MATSRDISYQLANLEIDLDLARTELEAAQLKVTRYLNLYNSQPSNQQYQTDLIAAKNEVEAIRAKIASIQNQISIVQNQVGDGAESSGTTAINASKARDNGANTQDPPTGQLQVGADGRVVNKTAVTTPSNAQASGTTGNGGLGTTDVGTNAPVRKLSDSQSTPPKSSNPATSKAPYPSATPGVGAKPDDNTATNSTKTTIDALFGTTAYDTPLPNILSQYASYTYSISLYLMSPENWQQLVSTKKRSITGAQLLMQSGGAPVGAQPGTTPGNSVTGANASAVAAQSSLGRNQYFPQDFYFEDIRIKSAVTGRGVQGAHNVVEVSFKIIEPNGISLFENLRKAVENYLGANGPGASSYAAQNYLMVIRFYGYDSAGNRISNNGQQTSQGLTDSNAIAEKFIPIQFSAVRMRIANRLTEYDCTAAAPQNAIGTGQALGVIPYNVEFTGTTLKDVLSGTPGTAVTAAQTGEATTRSGEGYDGTNGVNYSATNNGSNTQPEGRAGGGLQSFSAAQSGAVGSSIQSFDSAKNQTVTAGTSPTQDQAPQKAGSAPSKQTAVGLCEALNRYQAELVAKNPPVQRYPNEYRVILRAPVDVATMKPPGDTNFKYTPMPKPTTAAEGKLGSKQSNDPNSKNISAFAGMSIVQFIEQCVRNSSYITGQQTKNVVVDKEGQETTVPNGKPAQNLAWFRIDIEAVPQKDKFDDIRNDYAYIITYNISPYFVSSVKSDYFPESPVQVPHKEYFYWFTGQNSEVIDFSLDYNYLFYQVMSTGPSDNQTGNYHGIQKYSYQPKSNQSDAGAEGGVNEPSANAADYLYSPKDTSSIKITIVGDPAWIQQGTLWQGVTGTTPNYDKFNPDGEINYSGREVQFRINFNTPTDYDLSTGLMDSGKTNYNANRPQGIPGEAKQSLTYRTNFVTSIFQKGSFKQDIEGSQIFYSTAANVTADNAALGGKAAPDASRQSADADAQPGGFYGNGTNRASTNTVSNANAGKGLQSFDSAKAGNTGILSYQDAAGATNQSTTPAGAQQTAPAKSSPPTSGTQPVGLDQLLPRVNLDILSGLQNTATAPKPNTAPQQIKKDDQ